MHDTMVVWVRRRPGEPGRYASLLPARPGRPVGLSHRRLHGAPAAAPGFN